MPLQSIEPRRLYRQIADQVRALIRNGEFPVGVRLPAERDLAVQLGVSRPSVREALIALEVEGLVEVRVGSGIYVLAREAAPTARRVENAFGPFEIMQARQVVECELAAMAAHTMSRPQLDGLRESVREMESDVARGVMPMAGDRLFHLRLAEASENGPLVRVVSDLFDERNNPLFAQLGSHFESVPTWRAAVAEHQAVIDAIAEHDAQAARDAMRLHLQRSLDRFDMSWPNADDAETSARAEPQTLHSK